LDGSQPDEFNAINHVNVSNIVGVASSPLFGRADSAGLARTLQISVKYAFLKNGAMPIVLKNESTPLAQEPKHVCDPDAGR
jgi:hypothetical protein